MNFVTPLRICNKMILDRDFKEFEIKPRRILLSADIDEAKSLMEACKCDKINFLHLEFDESRMTEENGGLIDDCDSVNALDFIIENAWQTGIYIGFTPRDKTD